MQFIGFLLVAIVVSVLCRLISDTFNFGWFSGFLLGAAYAAIVERTRA